MSLKLHKVLQTFAQFLPNLLWINLKSCENCFRPSETAITSEDCNKNIYGIMHIL
jgi:hypothetical protein